MALLLTYVRISHALLSYALIRERILRISNLHMNLNIY